MFSCPLFYFPFRRERPRDPTSCSYGRIGSRGPATYHHDLFLLAGTWQIGIFPFISTLGLTEHLILCPEKTFKPMQVLHEMHLRISSSRPSYAFFGHFGSAISPRPMATKSALPSAIMESARTGSRMTPTVMTGIFTTFLMVPQCKPANLPRNGRAPRALASLHICRR